MNFEQDKTNKLMKNDITRDSLFDGKISCIQHREGYRFSIDSVLLAHFPKIRRNEKILDLGTGCGIIGLILCHRYACKNISISGLELQPDLAELARQNIDENGYGKRFSIIEGTLHDHRSLLEAESFNLVTANPPFYLKGTGRVNRNPEAMSARHQDQNGLACFVEAAAYGVKNRGRLVFIYPAGQAAELFFCFKAQRIEPKKMQCVYSYPGIKRGSLVIVEGIKNGGPGLEVLEPFYLYQYRNGPYSDNVQAMYQACEIDS